MIAEIAAERLITNLPVVADFDRARQGRMLLVTEEQDHLHDDGVRIATVALDVVDANELRAVLVIVLNDLVALL